MSVPLALTVNGAAVSEEIDPRSGRVLLRPAGDHPHNATYLNGKAYVGDEFGSTISEVGRSGTQPGSSPEAKHSEMS